MSNIIGSYKGYTGSLEYDNRSDILWGKILFIRDLVTFESLDGTPKSLKEQFELSVDEYLEDCQEEGETPDQPAKGSFNVRIPSETHLKALLYAHRHDISLNKFVAAAIDEKLADNGVHIHHHVENQIYTSSPHDASKRFIKGIERSIKTNKTIENQEINRGAEWAATTPYH